jgi:hypothetical protein
MPLFPHPEAILNADGSGGIELSTDGDRTTAAFILRILRDEFGATLNRHFFRNLMGDASRERDYWFLDIHGSEYMLLRCTAPEAPPGVFFGGPIKTPAELALFRTIARRFGAVEKDRRPSLRRPWWYFWKLFR